LNREIFYSLLEATLILEQWRVEYNQQRPHSALGHLTPTEFAGRQNPKWVVVSKHLNNPAGLFTTGPARADRFSKTVSPAPAAFPGAAVQPVTDNENALQTAKN